MKKFAVLYTGILLAMTAVLAVAGVNFLKIGNFCIGGMQRDECIADV